MLCLFLVNHSVVILCSKIVIWYYIELQIKVTTRGTKLTFIYRNKQELGYDIVYDQYRPPSGYGATDKLPYSQ